VASERRSSSGLFGFARDFLPVKSAGRTGATSRRMGFIPIREAHTRVRELSLKYTRHTFHLLTVDETRASYEYFHIVGREKLMLLVNLKEEMKNYSLRFHHV